MMPMAIGPEHPAGNAEGAWQLRLADAQRDERDELQRQASAIEQECQW